MATSSQICTIKEYKCSLSAQTLVLNRHHKPTELNHDKNMKKYEINKVSQGKRANQEIHINVIVHE